jgi:FkbM family methyltransferase
MMRRSRAVNTEDCLSRNDALVYDIGLHKGEDTDFYLKKGYEVVAFEANPTLVDFCRDRFAEQIRSGQLQIVSGAIAPPTDTGKVTFYVNERLSVWGTISVDFMQRNDKKGMKSKEVEVNRVDIVDSIRTFGMPLYMKIDIEGADSLVLEAMRNFEDRPQFLSFELNNTVTSQIVVDVETAYDLGYRRFQLVPMADMAGSHIETETIRGEKFSYVVPKDASGPFGKDLRGRWVTRDELLTIFKGKYHGWQDIHASLT